MSTVLIKNVIEGVVRIPELSVSLESGEIAEVTEMGSVKDVLAIPTVKLHVDRGRIEVFADKEAKASREKKPETSEIPKEIATEKKYTKDELSKLSMKALRKIGKPLGAKDTKKSELINEILAAQKGK